MSHLFEVTLSFILRWLHKRSLGRLWRVQDYVEITFWHDNHAFSCHHPASQTVQCLTSSERLLVAGKLRALPRDEMITAQLRCNVGFRRARSAKARCDGKPKLCRGACLRVVPVLDHFRALEVLGIKPAEVDLPDNRTWCCTVPVCEAPRMQVASLQRVCSCPSAL